ncbi:MAG: hypothetical protein QXS93_00185 [Candidatus Micrarchaeia archaeon]
MNEFKKIGIKKEKNLFAGAKEFFKGKLGAKVVKEKNTGRFANIKEKLKKTATYGFYGMMAASLFLKQPVMAEEPRNEVKVSFEEKKDTNEKSNVPIKVIVFKDANNNRIEIPYQNTEYICKKINNDQEEDKNNFENVVFMMNNENENENENKTTLKICNKADLINLYLYLTKNNKEIYAGFENTLLNSLINEKCNSLSLNYDSIYITDIYCAKINSKNYIFALRKFEDKEGNATGYKLYAYKINNVNNSASLLWQKYIKNLRYSIILFNNGNIELILEGSREYENILIINPLSGNHSIKYSKKSVEFDVPVDFGSVGTRL